MYIFIFTYSSFTFKGIVSRDFEGLQMTLMNRSWVPDVLLHGGWLFFKFLFSYTRSIISLKFLAGYAFINALSKSLVSGRERFSSATSATTSTCSAWCGTTAGVQLHRTEPGSVDSSCSWGREEVVRRDRLTPNVGQEPPMAAQPPCRWRPPGRNIRSSSKS